MNSIIKNIGHVSDTWKTYLSNKQNRLNGFFTLIILILVLISLPNFLQFIEKRNGFSFNDPVLTLFEPVNLTWLTFALIYISVVTAIFYLANKPTFLILALRTYAITALFRIIVMYLLPLNPPETMIPLNDPFVQFFGSGEVLTKDLFFSGHTSTLFILFLCVDMKKLKLAFLTGTVLVALFVVLQHVHYTIDVVAAPFFAYVSFELGKINAPLIRE
jgi:hypothetical protein